MTSIRTILVQLDGTDAAAARVQAAARLARTFDAELTGLYMEEEPLVASGALGLVPPSLLEEQTRARQRAAADAVARLRELAGKAGVPLDCRMEMAPPEHIAAIFTAQARHADLVVLGQTDPEHPPPGGRGFPDEVVLSCGRPALVIPYIGPRPTLGERAMIAWNAGREATRAVHDALPLLQAARIVHILMVEPRASVSGHGEEPGADIARHLARHGLRVEVHRVLANEIDAPNMILSQIADRDVDLLVMGAYGHSRARELVLGGVTREILRSMTVPVLMSH